MPDELPHHREPVRLDVRLDRVADVRDPAPDLHLRDALVERFLRDAEQRLHVLADRADGNRNRRVPVVAVQLHAHVERHDVAGHERRRRRDPVHHLLVHRRAQRGRIAAVSLEGRLGARRPHLRFRRPVEIRGAHARRDHRRELLENARDQLVRRAHLLDLRRRLADDHRTPPVITDASRIAASIAAVTTSGGWLPSIVRNVGRDA